MTFMQFATGLAAIIGLLILIGGAIALVRGSYNKARIQALREDNDDLRARLNDCDKKISEHVAAETLLEQKVDHLTSENVMLTQMVTQRANVDEVITLLNVHHVQSMEYWERMTTAMEGMRDEQH